MHEHLHGHRKPGPLNLDIYSALLGGRPRIAPRESTDAPAERRRVRVEVPVEPTSGDPLLDAALRDQLGRCLTQASRVLADVRSRLVGMFQESTIGRKDRRARPRVDVTTTRGDRSKHAA